MTDPLIERAKRTAGDAAFAERSELSEVIYDLLDEIERLKYQLARKERNEDLGADLSQLRRDQRCADGS